MRYLLISLLLLSGCDATRDLTADKKMDTKADTTQSANTKTDEQYDVQGTVWGQPLNVSVHRVVRTTHDENGNAVTSTTEHKDEHEQFKGDPRLDALLDQVQAMGGNLTKLSGLIANPGGFLASNLHQATSSPGGGLLGFGAGAEGGFGTAGAATLYALYQTLSNRKAHAKKDDELEELQDQLDTYQSHVKKLVKAIDFFRKDPAADPKMVTMLESYLDGATEHDADLKQAIALAKS